MIVVLAEPHRVESQAFGRFTLLDGGLEVAAGSQFGYVRALRSIHHHRRALYRLCRTLIISSIDLLGGGV
jgi:hypothetical protein